MNARRRSGEGKGKTRLVDLSAARLVSGGEAQKCLKIQPLAPHRIAPHRTASHCTAPMLLSGSSALRIASARIVLFEALTWFTD
ncbi:hypothetical protein E2C01_074124 [Portunus trituberculatus]|uniref:Uncharacterized protein n=1 Tax=Portunus trituberculatus TaxID=210409 RepID=A0A5B7ICH7_PORTR|nr:hypothetical protein [Portunus trituberculatus]